jgi:hypothetical protein
MQKIEDFDPDMHWFIIRGAVQQAALKLRTNADIPEH